MIVTMDRYEADWRIVERGWKAHVLGEALNVFRTSAEALAELKRKQPDVSDQVGFFRISSSSGLLCSYCIYYSYILFCSICLFLLSLVKTVFQ